MRSPLLEQWFPDLAAWGYEITSEITFEYNCIAWSVDDTTQNWWPFDDPSNEVYWPKDAPREPTLAAFIAAYRSLGFVECRGDELEPDHDKIAIFVDESGEPTHAAKQLTADQWTSKMGPYHDIRHPLKAIEGQLYGRVALFMKRPRRASTAPL